MKTRYWILIFTFYIFAVIVQEKASVWDFIGFIILILAFIVAQKKKRIQEEPYIIGDSNKVEYLTQEELEKRFET